MGKLQHIAKGLLILLASCQSSTSIDTKNDAYQFKEVVFDNGDYIRYNTSQEGLYTDTMLLKQGSDNIIILWKEGLCDNIFLLDDSLVELKSKVDRDSSGVLHPYFYKQEKPTDKLLLGEDIIDFIGDEVKVTSDYLLINDTSYFNVRNVINSHYFFKMSSKFFKGEDNFGFLFDKDSVNLNITVFGESYRYDLPTVTFKRKSFHNSQKKLKNNLHSIVGHSLFSFGS